MQSTSSRGGRVKAKAIKAEAKRPGKESDMYESSCSQTSLVPPLTSICWPGLIFLMNFLRLIIRPKKPNSGLEETLTRYLNKNIWKDFIRDFAGASYVGSVKQDLIDFAGRRRTSELNGRTGPLWHSHPHGEAGCCNCQLNNYPEYLYREWWKYVKINVPLPYKLYSALVRNLHSSIN